MLAGWANDDEWQGRVGWLSLDEADDEPVRFWTYALSALESVAPQLTRESLAALKAPGMDPVGVALPLLLNATITAEDSYALVLDDFHVVGDPMIHQSVEFLLTYLTPGLRLVIASREDPPLPLARLRARGKLTEIRVAELRCTSAEGVELLAGVGGMPQMPAGTGEALVQRTEGWPAGLQLAAIALRDSEDPDAVAAGLRGDGRHLLDYFTAEVLPGLGRRQRELLVRCSVLERLSGQLCDAVLQSADAGDLLDELERTGHFVSALSGGWYRCHQLFREVLRRELDRDQGANPAAVLGRAADWFLDRGQLEEAVEHRRAAGDDAGALELLLNSNRWFIDHGMTAAILRLGEELAPGVVDPRLFVALAAAAGERGRGERCAHWLKRAEPLIGPESEPLQGWRTLRAEADVFASVFLAAGDAELALHYAGRAVHLEDDPTLIGYVVARQALCGALYGAGQLPEAIEVMRDGWEAPARRDLPWLMLLPTAGLLAEMLFETGDLEGARRILLEVHDEAASAEQAWGLGAAAAVAELRLVEARLTFANDPPAAIPGLERAVELAEAWSWPTLSLLALSHLASAQWAVGDRATARTCVDRAFEIAESGEVRPEAVRHLEGLASRIGRGAAKAARARGALAEELTDREVAILRALRGPLSAREIASEMYLSINTVKGYNKSLYRKLGVVTRADAVHRAHELGLI